ncbi:MAG: conjugal transfer protein TraX [Clostridiales bacterium]|nr:conjugal transfer protein TraX [Clostridiales bacterium]
MEENTRLETTSASLHIMGMIFMLLDHLWGTIVPGNDWMTCIGRLAFPIFAFMIAEGYMRTSNVKKYAKRMFIFALITEIPFNLAFGGNLLYPFHQNVLFTFLIAIGLIHLNEKARKNGKVLLRILTAIGTVILGSLIGLITMVDYHHAGVLTVLVFYFFGQGKWWSYIGQFICLWYINMEMLGGFGYEVELFGQLVFLSRQGFALLALIPIWLYRGERGHHSKAFQYFCYAFYPAHLLILAILGMIL